mgnify:CR=1 FL=1
MNSFLKHLGMVALALLPALSSAALQPGKVEVGKLTGTASLVDSKGVRTPLAVGADLQEGAIVETGLGAYIELVFSNGASTLLAPDSLVAVRTFRQVGAPQIASPFRKIEKDPSPSVTEIEVLRGKIVGEVRKPNALSIFTVKTPAGVVRVRGAVFDVEYRVCAHGFGHIMVDCVRGSVEAHIFSSDAGPLTVEPGHQISSSVASSALIAKVTKPSSAPSAATASSLSEPVRIMLYPIPAEYMAALAALLEANSTLPAEVAATISAMAASMPARGQIFATDAETAACLAGGPHADREPLKVFGTVISGAQVTDTLAKEDKSNAPGGPSNTTTGGSTVSDGSVPTLDATLKKITDNVSRMVEHKQLQVTPTGG